MTKIKLLFVNLLFLALVSCAGGRYKKLHDDMAKNLSEQKYDIALNIVKNNDFFSKKNSILLRNLERGIVYYKNGQYYQALNYMDEAEKIAEELYTVSIKDALVNSFMNNGFGNYKGDKYEISLIRFYKSLLNYKLYKIGKYEATDKNPEKILSDEERITHLRKARSNVMNWESLLNGYKTENFNKNTYTQDLLQKIWGSFIFKENEGISDVQRADAMLVTAEKILKGEYLVYPSFNAKNEDYKNYLLKEKRFAYISETENAEDLSNQIKTMKNSLSVSSKNHNLMILVNENVVTPIKSTFIETPLPVTFFKVYDPLLHIFVLKSTINKNGVAYFRVEVPYMEEEISRNEIIAEIFDKNKKLIKTLKVNLINPVSEISYRTFKEKEEFLIKLKVDSVGRQYAEALERAYAKIDILNPLTTMLALDGFKSDKKSIDSMNEIDTRSWKSLPANIRLVSDKLPKGEYILVLKSINNDNSTNTVHTSEFEIGNDTKLLDVNI